MKNNRSNYRYQKQGHTVRLLVPPDIDAVIDTEMAACRKPLSAKRLCRLLDQAHCRGMVVEGGPYQRPIGHLLYYQGLCTVGLVRLVVHPNHTNLGVGTVLLEQARTLLNFQRPTLTALVDERELRLLQFLRARGLQADQLLRGTKHDWVHFSYRRPDVWAEAEWDALMKQDLATIPNHLLGN